MFDGGMEHLQCECAIVSVYSRIDAVLEKSWTFPN
jgi:hypothetical protein